MKLKIKHGKHYAEIDLDDEVYQLIKSIPRAFFSISNNSTPTIHWYQKGHLRHQTLARFIIGAAHGSHQHGINYVDTRVMNLQLTNLRVIDRKSKLDVTDDIPNILSHNFVSRHLLSPRKNVKSIQAELVGGGSCALTSVCITLEAEVWNLIRHLPLIMYKARPTILYEDNGRMIYQTLSRFLMGLDATETSPSIEYIDGDESNLLLDNLRVLDSKLGTTVTTKYSNILSSDFSHLNVLQLPENTVPVEDASDKSTSETHTPIETPTVDSGEAPEAPIVDNGDETDPNKMGLEQLRDYLQKKTHKASLKNGILSRAKANFITALSGIDAIKGIVQNPMISFSLKEIMLANNITSLSEAEVCSALYEAFHNYQQMNNINIQIRKVVEYKEEKTVVVLS